MKKLDMTRVRELAVHMTTSDAMTLDEIAAFTKTSTRTAYRWILILEEIGHNVVRKRRPEGGFVFKILPAA